MSITERANLGISFAFQQPVRFKGMQVLDLIRLAAHDEEAVRGGRLRRTFPRWDSAPETTSTGK